MPACFHPDVGLFPVLLFWELAETEEKIGLTVCTACGFAVYPP
jgi:hypothetical protein